MGGNQLVIMQHLLSLSVVVVGVVVAGVVGLPSKPVVYSYASNAAETTGSGSYEGEPTTQSASIEEETTEHPYKEPDKYEKESGKELLQPRFFAYSDQYPNDEKDQKFTKGGGQEHNTEHDLVQGHKGDKGYKDYHKYAKGQKGVHDKESHKGKYIDSKGVKGKKKEEGGHFGLHHHEEKGRKAAKYGESGEHKKGHHTKGEHNIHKKDEYVKKHEFYDEHHEGGEHEKNGGFHQMLTKKKGGKKRRGHRKSSGAQKVKGKKAQRKKIAQVRGFVGHSREKGVAGQYKSLGKFSKKGKNRKRKQYIRPVATHPPYLQGEEEEQ